MISEANTFAFGQIVSSDSLYLRDTPTLAHDLDGLISDVKSVKRETWSAGNLSKMSKCFRELTASSSFEKARQYSLFF